jgi:hypothetical protein
MQTQNAVRLIKIEILPEDIHIMHEKCCPKKMSKAPRGDGGVQLESSSRSVWIP